MEKPTAATGALVGILLTVPLLALLFSAERLLGLPFVPFDLFDSLTRLLPGQVVTLGIDAMVKGVQALGLTGTDTAAKTAEQVMAIGGVLLAGAAGGAIFFVVLRATRRRNPRLAGLLFGAIGGLVVVLITGTLDRRGRVSPQIADLWTVAASLFWGLSLGWAHVRLTRAPDGPQGSGDVPVAVERASRRQFIVRLGGTAATITVAGAVVGAVAGSRRRVESASGRAWSATHALPNAGADVEPAPGTRKELTPLDDHYRIDINTVVPHIDEAAWSLKVGGLVEQPVELTLRQIRGYEPMHQFVTLACISNPVAGSLIGTTRWTGVSLRRLLPDLKLKSGATHLKLSAEDGFFEVVALDTVRSDERVMLAYAWDGLPLEPKHGFPLRIYIPDLYGMKQPKWLTSIDAQNHWEEGYWVKRGWDRNARMKATSVIDTISVNMMLSQAGQKTRIPVGGIAHAGAQGISKVEVRVDGGPWSEAGLRAPLSSTTWVIWRYDWAFVPGNHTFEVRCFDSSGRPQIAEPAPPHPSGASGLHSKSMML